MHGPDGQRLRWLRWLDRLPIRWRLAVVSAVLTGLILLLFAIGVGRFTAERVRGDFVTQTAARFDTIRSQLDLRLDPTTGQFSLGNDLRLLRGDPDTVIAVFVGFRGGVQRVQTTDSTIDIGLPGNPAETLSGLQISSRQFQQPVINALTGQPWTQPTLSLDIYRGPGVLGRTTSSTASVSAVVEVRMGRNFSSVAHTTRRIWGALGIGVLLGTLLALIAGVAVGERAMRPVKRMTSTARHIARTRDLDAKMPTPQVNDEIAELAGTLQDMLDELAVAQAKVDASLQSQRDFVADASHELRTPLTSVQANLELLALTTQGEDREAVASALRSSRRMKLLVSDLLLLARMDAQRQVTRAPIELDRAILEAIDELEPQIGDHVLDVDVEPVTIDGVRDELVRMVANLVGNALRHTPDGTTIRVRLRATGARGELVVEDDGPGIPAELRERIFERFVRRGGESAGSTGIGLAIVRAAAQHHGGDARFEPVHPDGSGARFVVTFAVATVPAPPDDAGPLFGAGARER
ncbi:MAG: HAMP domain-containing histidine kinase [Patulibacter sp.]|nr:HAMP domain-containing histidine kinase [Patulibacter sp.]